MRRIVMAVVVVSVAAILAPAAAPAQATGFNGFWRAQDVGDGSHMTLFIAGGTTKSVVLFDNFGMFCQSPIVVVGSATESADGSELTFTGSGFCLKPGATEPGPAVIVFSANADGTLSDDGTSGAGPHGWHRVS
jgi:hypothetical protein